jgi:hypothetical protein
MPFRDFPIEFTQRMVREKSPIRVLILARKVGPILGERYRHLISTTRVLANFGPARALIGFAPEARSLSPRNTDRLQPGTVIDITPER